MTVIGREELLGVSGNVGTVWSVIGLQCKLSGLSLIPQNSHKKQGIGTCVHNPKAGDGETGGALGLSG